MFSVLSDKKFFPFSQAPKEESEVEIPKEEEKPKDPMMNSEDEKIRDKIMAAEELLRKVSVKLTSVGFATFPRSIVTLEISLIVLKCLLQLMTGRGK